MARLIAAAGIALLLLGCSSAPDQPEQIFERQNQGSRYADFGNAYFAQGQYPRALYFFQLALNEHRAVDNEEGICRSLNSVGSVYLAAGHLDAAERNFRDALSIAEKLEDPALIALSHNNTGELALRREKATEAVGSFERALEYVSSEDRAQEAIIRHNLGVALLRQNNLEDAEASFRRALSLNEAEKRKAEAAANWYMLASLRSRQGDYPEAADYARRALELDKQMENSLGIAKDLKALGTIHARMEELPLALDYTRRALEVYVALNMVRETGETLETLEALSRQAGDENGAEEYRRQRERLEDI